MIQSLFKTMEEDDSGNHCVVCGVDMGACNPRQLCCKTYCPTEKWFDSHEEDYKQNHVKLMDNPIINCINELVKTGLTLNLGEFNSNLTKFLQTYQDVITVYTGLNSINQQPVYIVELDQKILFRCDKSGKHACLTFYRYPMAEPNIILFLWETVVTRLPYHWIGDGWILSQNIRM